MNSQRDLELILRSRVPIVVIETREESRVLDLAQIAAATKGFSGAEIEQAIVSALHAAHAQKKSLATEHLLAEIQQTKPLSVVMAERIALLRRWAEGRTVACD